MSDPRSPELEQLLVELLAEDADLTARNVVRRSDGLFKHASDLTRNSSRRAILYRFQEQQRILKDLAKRLDHSSKPQLLARIESLQRENELLKARQRLLVSGLRGVLHALGEIGGMRAWRKFFPSYSAAFKELVTLGELPSADVVRSEIE